MAKPRSPILGYNHNIRYRGLVFHVQTEDSGIQNPHVFTHLFHGGVILQTRKLVYDASASEEAVKALMQAQHKAVLKDLKRGLFDDKMDAYLGGTPGLLPRGQGVDGEAPAEVPAGTPPPLAPPEDSAPIELEAAPTIPTSVPDPPPTTSRVPTPVPTPASIAIPPPSRNSGRMAAVGGEAIDSRAPTERFSPAQALSMPPVTTREPRRDVSNAFNAIVVGDGEAAPAGGGLVEVPDDAAVEIHAAAPPSAATPPGVEAERPGSYAQYRRRDSGRYAPGSEPPPAGAPNAARASVPRPAPATSRPSTTMGAPPVPRPAPLARPPTPLAKPSAPAPLPSYPSGRPASPAPPVTRPGLSRTRSPSGGGVVVTRPAVIVGAPARTVGSHAPSPPAATPTKTAAPPPRVRKAREESDSGIFGQDLISEKSLDEVILAYLSEDPNDE